MTNISIMQETFDTYGRIYEHIFRELYPAKNSTGFPERNLSVNFSKAYEKVAEERNQNVVSWFEFQFGEKNNNHVDLVILNKTSKEFIIVESKRFSNPIKKIEEMGKDIQRIYALERELRTDNDRIHIDEMEHVYGVILADVWLGPKMKDIIYDSYQSKSFISNFANELSWFKDLKEDYYITEFSELSAYKLLSIVWRMH